MYTDISFQTHLGRKSYILNIKNGLRVPTFLLPIIMKLCAKTVKTIETAFVYKFNCFGLNVERYEPRELIKLQWGQVMLKKWHHINTLSGDLLLFLS